MTEANTNHEKLNTHTTVSETQSGTGAASVAVGDERHVETTTTKQKLDTNIILAIQCGNASMHKQGNDATWHDDDDWEKWDQFDRDARDYGDEPQWASAADEAQQDGYWEMIAAMHDEEFWEHHPYFNNRYTRGSYSGWW